jgi:hypothetical protein
MARYQIGLGVSLTVALFVALSACDRDLSPAEFQKYLDDPAALRVDAQVCLPNKTAYFDELSVDVTDIPDDMQLAERSRLYARVKETGQLESTKTSGAKRISESIRQWRLPSSPNEHTTPWVGFGFVKQVQRVGSSGAGSARLIGSTEKDQAVYAEFVHERLQDVMAVSVTMDVERDGARVRRIFWYKLPKQLKHMEFSDWIAPISEEDPQTATFSNSIAMPNGREMAIYKVHDNAPFVRFTLKTRAEQWQELTQGNRAIDAVKLQRIVEGKPIDSQSIYLVPTIATMPPC